MAIQGGGQPHFPAQSDTPSIESALKPGEAATSAPAPSHAQKTAASVGPSTLAQIPAEAENRQATGPQNGSTPVSAGRANNVAQAVFTPKPPPGRSPRSKQAVAKPQPSLPTIEIMEPIGGGALPVKALLPKAAPKVPELRPGKPRASPEEIAAHKKYLATEKRRPPSPAASRVQQGNMPVKLTTAYHSFKEAKEKEMAALNQLKAADSEKVKHEMQGKVDKLYPVIAQCIAEKRVPILENGVLKAGGSEKSGHKDNSGYEHIANTFAEAYTQSRGLVGSTNEKDFRGLLNQLLEMGMPQEIFDKAHAALDVPKELLQEAARAKALEGVEQAAPLPPSMPTRELYERVLMGDPQAADALIFSHRSSAETARPFAALQEIIHNLPANVPPQVKRQACENALAFATLYLETAASVPVDPAKKAALKEEIAGLLASVATNSTTAAQNEVKAAIANHLQPPSTGDVVWALNQARSSLNTPADLDKAFNMLELARGRMEPAVIDARNALRLALGRLPNSYRFDQRSAHELTIDLGDVVERTFRSMKPGEMESLAFSNKQSRKTDGPAMMEAIEQFDRISDFLKLQILENVSLQNGVEVRTAKTPEEAAKAMAKVIDIGHEALRNGNYQLALIASSALSNYAVSRLQAQLLANDPVSRQKAEALIDFFDPISDYKKYQIQEAKDREAGKRIVPLVIPLQRSVISLKEAGNPIAGQVDLATMTKRAKLKKQLAEDLQRMRARPLLQGHPGAGLAAMRQHQVNDEVLEGYSVQIRPRPNAV